MRNLKFPLTYIIMHKAEFTVWSIIDRIYWSSCRVLCEQKYWQTGVKILPCPKVCLRAVTTAWFLKIESFRHLKKISTFPYGPLNLTDTRHRRLAVATGKCGLVIRNQIWQKYGRFCLILILNVIYRRTYLSLWNKLQTNYDKLNLVPAALWIPLLMIYHIYFKHVWQKH